ADAGHAVPDGHGRGSAFRALDRHLLPGRQVDRGGHVLGHTTARPELGARRHLPDLEVRVADLTRQVRGFLDRGGLLRRFEEERLSLGGVYVEACHQGTGTARRTRLLPPLAGDAWGVGPMVP